MAQRPPAHIPANAAVARPPANNPDADLERVLRESAEEAKREEAKRQQQAHLEEEQLMRALRESQLEFDKKKQKDEWACSLCTFSNKNKALKCEMCNTAKPGSGAPEQKAPVAAYVPQPQPQAVVIAAAPQPQPHLVLYAQPQQHVVLQAAAAAPPMQQIVRKTYHVPSVSGTFILTVKAAHDIPLPKSGITDVYAVMRIMEPTPTGKLRVNVLNARELRDTQLLGKQDPYCKIRLDKTEYTTRVHEDGNREAKWEQQFMFNLAGTAEEQQLQLEVRNSNVLKDATIGRANVGTALLLEKSGQGKFEVRLSDPGDFSSMAGYVTLSVENDERAFTQRTVARQQSETVKGGTNPEFNNAQFSFPKTTSDSFVHVALWDKRLVGKDVFLGQTALLSIKDGLKMAHFSGGRPTIVPLQQGQAEAQGTLELFMRFTNNEFPAGLHPQEQTHVENVPVASAPPAAAVAAAAPRRPIEI